MPGPFANERLLRQLWDDATLTNRQIAQRLKITESYLCKLRERLELPRRCPAHSLPSYDPTPEEIAVRAAQCRQKHLAQRRAEKDETSCSRVASRKRRQLTRSA